MAQVDVRSQAVRIVRLIAAWLGRWPIALAACGLLAAGLLLPRLDGPGLWEPQERQLSDRIAPPASAKPPAAAPTPDVRPKDGCLRSVPPNAAARTLTARAIVWGRDTIDDSDGGRRFPLALLGLLTVLAAAGTAMRLAGARAGVVTAIVLLAMPLCALQSRMLTSEIGTASGASLIVYGLVALGDLRRNRRAPVPRDAAKTAAKIAIDGVVSVAALAAGLVLGFYGGGVLLGLVVPIGAVAVAGLFGGPLTATSRALLRHDPAVPWGGAAVAVLATLATLGLVGLLAYQLYDLKPLYPGLTPPPARELLGRAIIPNGCYSWALGGIWRPEDDLRVVYDSTFEQIAYGTFPWGLLAPIALLALLGASDPRRRWLGAISLAWAGAAWVAGEVFLRKVGFTVYAGFPALAIAVGVWLDAMFAGRASRDARAMPPGTRLIALFAVIGTIDLGKDLQSFAERLTSLLVGNDAVPYPAQAGLLLKVLVLIIGFWIATSFATAITAWRSGDSPHDRSLRNVATGAAIAAIGLTVLLAAFWTAIWQPRLALHLSSKTMFETYRELARPGDELVVMGDLGQAPLAYATKAPQTVTDRGQIIAALGRSDPAKRVFAIAPQTELCTLHREIAGKPYFVIDDRNQRSLLLSNRLDDAIDRNPLRTTILHDEPKDIPYRPKGKVVWDNRIQLLGWNIPRSAIRGGRFEVTLYYKILQPVGGSWKTLMHFDGAAGRAGNGDHEPIGGRCPTSSWQLGDYIVDRFTTAVGGGAFPRGPYDIWTGFFTGAAPNWRNMTVSEAPGDIRDNADRVKITTIELE